MRVKTVTEMKVLATAFETSCTLKNLSKGKRALEFFGLKRNRKSY